MNNVILREENEFLLSYVIKFALKTLNALIFGNILRLLARKNINFITAATLFLFTINVKNFRGSLTTVVRAQNDTSKTANITDTIFD